ncbi:M48 family metallopeptidase [Maliponia aquimaris]|uniref:Metalloprotease LoiP n=1 Tax=Maliponia aquimaris TaxID=1673631 RepID=A0A238KVP4_9RHOB|nr:M48 family metallopeptidase [Maliponia aquimaris]SMX46691.1 Metalloprotease LoiP precursor [Maliponia aquimaris]
MILPLHTGPFEAEGLYFDGLTAEARPVTLRIDEDRRALVAEGIDWPLDEIRELTDVAGADLVILRLKDDEVARLILKDASIRPRLPNRTRAAPLVRRGRLMAWAVGAVASVALILFVLVPTMADQLAEFIPPEGEKALGEVTLTQIREALDETGLGALSFCTDPYGEAALRKIEARLVATMDPPVDITVHVLNHEMVNAFALPGGHVVFFRGLLDEAGTPEEIAAVFAHEIGHVVSRDPTRHALRSAGSLGVLGLIFGDFAGGFVVLMLTEQLIQAQYSQDAEAAADGFAHDMMRKAQIAPSSLAAMFETFRKLGGDAEGLLAHFMSHPQLGDRIAAAQEATPPGFVPRPLLTPAEWAALKDICKGDSLF